MLRVNINYLDEIGRVREFQASVNFTHVLARLRFNSLIQFNYIFDKMFLFKSVEKKKELFRQCSN